MKRLLQAGLSVVGPWLYVTAVHAAKCGDVEIGTPGLRCEGDGNPIYAFLQFMINWIIKLLGAVAVLIIASSPIFMVLSAGSPDGVKKAKVRLQNAVIGLILLSLMFVILKQIGIVQ